MTELPFLTGEHGKGHFLVLLFFVSVTVVTAWGIWNWALPASSEAIIAEEAREMRVGSPFTVRFDGEEAWDAPPLVPLLMALSYRLFGVDDFGARFVFVILSIFAIYIVYLAGAAAASDLRLGCAEGADAPAGPAPASSAGSPSRCGPSWVTIPRAVGFLSGVVLAATPLFGRFSPHVTLGIPLAFFTAVALLGWIVLPAKRFGAALWALGLAGGIMSAGASGLLIVAAAGVASAVDGERRRSWRMPLFIAATIFGAGAPLVWLVPASLRAGSAAAAGPLLGPFANLLKPAGGFGALLSSAIGTFLRSLPWSIAAAFAAWRVLFAGRGTPRAALPRPATPFDASLLVMILVLFVPLGLGAGGGDGSALLPVAPLGAMLAAREIARWFGRFGGDVTRRLWSFNHLMTALFCLLMLLLVATPIKVRQWQRDPFKDIAHAARELTPEGSRIGTLRQCRREQRARLLFYGRRSCDRPVETAAEAADAFRADPAKLFLASAADVEELKRAADFPCCPRIVFGMGDYVLFGLGGAPADAVPADAASGNAAGGNAAGTSPGDSTAASPADSAAVR